MLMMKMVLMLLLNMHKLGVGGTVSVTRVRGHRVVWARHVMRLLLLGLQGVGMLGVRVGLVQVGVRRWGHWALLLLVAVVVVVVVVWADTERVLRV